MFFKTEIKYDYMKEVDGNVYIDPAFYSAYSYVRKALINTAPDSELLSNIDTTKKYYSINLKIKPNQLLKNVQIDYSSNTRSNIHVEEVNVSKLFFKIIEIMPYYHTYKFYKDTSIQMIELQVPIRKGVLRPDVSYSANTLTEDLIKIKNKTYRRGHLEYVDTINLNQLFIYLSLGKVFFPTLTSFEINSIEEYLNNLKNTVISIQSTMDRFTPSKNTISSVLTTLTNEERTSFIQAINGVHFNFDDFLDISLSERTEATIPPYYYPVSIEKESVFYDRDESPYLGTPRRASHLNTEEGSILEKINMNESDNNKINVQTEINNSLHTLGYNMYLIYTQRESRHLSYRKIRKHRQIINYKKHALTKVKDLYTEQLKD